MTQTNLPFEDQNVWEYLRWNSYLSEKHKLLYISTSKVACTSLKWWFASLEGYAEILSKVADSGESDPELVVHDSFHKVAPSVVGLMPDALAESLVSDEYFRFAVVRNPYKRIFSAWQSKLMMHEPIQSVPYTKCDFFWMPIKNKEEIALAFEGFLEHLAAHEAPNYLDLHWTPQVNLLRPDLISYTNLSQIENTKKLKLELVKHLGPDIPDPFSSRHANESLIPYLPDFITQRAAELIQLLYAKDFQTFGYDRQLPEPRDGFSAAQLDVAIQAVGLIRGRHRRLGEIIASRSKQTIEHESQVFHLSQTVIVRNKQITDLNQAVVERDRQIADLNQAVVEQDRQITDLNKAVVERDGQIAGLTTTLNEIYLSKAWHFIQMYRKNLSRIIAIKKGIK